MPAVAAVFIRPDGKVLMERRHDSDTFWPNEYLFPRGKLEAGETVEAALRREVWEELGVSIPKADRLLSRKHIFWKQSLEGKLEYELFAYIVWEWRGKIPDYVQDSNTPLTWHTLEEALSYPVPAVAEIAQAAQCFYREILLEEFRVKRSRLHKLLARLKQELKGVTHAPQS